jgi:hypothetical protein
MSFIYRHILLYRIIMNLLYLGKYKKRFGDIIALFEKEDRIIVELCFGDIYIASHCRKTGKAWTGYDMNKSFVAHATNKGFSAEAVDVITMESLPPADVCIMAGSLYHFHDFMDKLFLLMLASTRKIIISEPVKNITSSHGMAGKIAACLSNAGKGREQFRFNHESLKEILDYYEKKYKFNYEILSEGKDILLKITHERNQRRHTDL